jgi:hypothetical protein
LQWQLQKGTRTLEEFYKEMEVTMKRAHIEVFERKTVATFYNGPSYQINKIVEFLPYATIVDLVHQATRVERHGLNDKFSIT